MKQLAEFLGKYESNLALLANKYFILILYCLKSSENVMKIQEISEHLGIPTVKLNQYLDYLIRIGFIKKVNKLDKSKTPAFITTYYEINEVKFDNLLENLRTITDQLEK